MNLPEILEWTLRTTLAVIVLGIILAIHRNRIAASLQFALWLSFGVLIAGSFFFADVLPEWNVIPRFWEGEQNDSSFVVNRAPEPMPEILPQIGAASGESTFSETPSNSNTSLSWWVCLWIVGVLVFAIRLVASFRYLSFQREEFPGDHPAKKCLSDLIEASGSSVSVRLVGHAGNPMTWGLIRPVIALPTDCSEWEKERLEMVLRHELAHIARRDPMWLLFSQIVLSLFWFHPGLWMVSSRLRETREQAADALVLRQGIPSADYADVILSFMGMPRTSGAAVALCGIVSSGHARKAKGRIDAVLRGRSTQAVSASMKFAMSLLILASVGLITTSVAVQPEKRESNTVVILDAGHGAHDTGAKSELGLEKDYNLDVTLKLEAILKEEGIACILTRREDQFMLLADRAKVANKIPNSIFVSVHHNSSRSGELEGVEIYHPEGKGPRELDSLDLAKNLLSHVTKKTGAKSRGLRPSNMSAPRGLLVPGILIECGFVTHAEESLKIDTDDYRQKMAEGIAEGLAEYISSAKKENPIAKRIVPVLDPPLAAIPLADGFDYPVGSPDGKGYFVYRGFENNGHLGEDWNGVSGGNNDHGDPVSCIGNGKVVLARDLKKGWGNVVIVRHKFRAEDDQVKVIDSLYGHLDQIDVKEGDLVKKGQLIATIGRGPHNMYAAHLHFEIRKNTKIGMERSLFGKTFNNYYSPRRFIEANR